MAYVDAHHGGDPASESFLKSKVLASKGMKDAGQRILIADQGGKEDANVMLVFKAVKGVVRV